MKAVNTSVEVLVSIFLIFFVSLSSVGQEKFSNKISFDFYMGYAGLKKGPENWMVNNGYNKTETYYTGGDVLAIIITWSDSGKSGSTSYPYSTGGASMDMGIDYQLENGNRLGMSFGIASGSTYGSGGMSMNYDYLQLTPYYRINMNNSMALKVGPSVFRTKYSLSKNYNYNEGINSIRVGLMAVIDLRVYKYLYLTTGGSLQSAVKFQDKKNIPTSFITAGLKFRV